MNILKGFKKIKELTTESEEKTVKYAFEFAENLKAGDVVGLIGELGAGKTQFVKGVAKHYKISKDQVVSPTFTYVKEYKGKGIMLYQFDFYRLDNKRDLEKLGYRDYYLADDNAIILIEWMDRVEETMDDANWIVKIEHKGKDNRKICLYRRKN